MGAGPSGALCCASHAALATFAKSHVDEHFGVGTSEALQRLAELLQRVEAKIAGGRRFSHPFMLNMGMLLKQVAQERRYKTPLTTGAAFEDAKVLRKAGRYARYALAAPSTEKRAIADCIGDLQPEDVKHVQAGSIAICPGYFITMDHATDDIVLCIRGAEREGPAEGLAEALSPKEPLLGGNAHAGLLKRAKGLVECASQTLTRLSSESPRKGLAVVGHGVGGGIATLATILLSADGCPFAKLMATGKVKCYAFAPSPSFEPLWALPAWVHGSTYSFIYNMDCVPRACIGTVTKLYLALQSIDELPLSAERRLAYLRGECEMPYILPDYTDVPQAMADIVGNSLFVVGTIVALFPAEHDMMRCEVAAPHMVDRILLHPDMVHDHAMSCLEQAFFRLGSQFGTMDGCAIS